jgi:hypothetical protein
MKCSQRKNIAPYLFGQLIGVRLRHFKAHLAKCRTCSAELNILGKVKKTIAGQESELPKINVVDRVMAKLKGRQEMQPRVEYKRAAPITPPGKRKGRGK